MFLSELDMRCFADTATISPRSTKALEDFGDRPTRILNHEDP